MITVIFSIDTQNLERIIMKEKDHHLDISKLSLAGLLVTLGLVYGDIGTSPLYTVKAIIGNARTFNELLIYGCIVMCLLDTDSSDNNKIYSDNPEG